MVAGAAPTPVAGPADRFERPAAVGGRPRPPESVALGQTAGTRRHAAEIVIDMPDDQTVPVAVQLRDVATRWWVPGAVVPDVLQRTGFFPRAFFHDLVPEKIGPNQYRVRLERGWFARLCGAQLHRDPGVNVVTVQRNRASGPEQLVVQLEPDPSQTRASSTCSVPAGATGDLSNPLVCTVPLAAGRGASTTIRLDWPR
jgi:hypothetical protein